MLRRAAAELLGTYALVTAGCGAIVVTDPIVVLREE